MSEGSGTPDGILRLACEAMATRFEVVIEEVDRTTAIAAGEDALEEIRNADARFSRFRADSVISLLNREASGRPVKVDRELFDLLEECVRHWRDSGGAFDPGLGMRMGAVGSGADGGPVAGVAGLKLDPGSLTVRFRTADLQLDLGGIGKGWALDRAVEALRAAGVRSAFLHGGTSSVAAVGAPPGRDAWEVAIADPRRSGTGVARVRLFDLALSVSAPRGRAGAAPEDRGGPVLDPRTGRPAAAGVALAAVVHPRGSVAEAWSTALVAGAPLPGMAAEGEARNITALVVPEDAAAPVRIAGPREGLFLREPLSRRDSR